MSGFEYLPSPWVPFQDKEVLDRVRKIRREDIDRHPNPSFRIRVVPDNMVEHLFVTDMFFRIKTAADESRKCVLILPNPNHGYIKVAHLINAFRVDCRHLHIFVMDEYADQDGNIAPESFPQSFLRACKSFLYRNIDEALRPPEEQIVGPTNENIAGYGKIIEDLGGADACYSGPGWTGHLAFVEPDSPEFDYPLTEWKTLGARVVTLSPFTIAQNSLHGSFGMSGDLALVPPKAATIGPAEVLAAKYRMDIHALTTAGSDVSWQRLVSRLVLHGPVTPRVPESILQTTATEVLVTETIARNITPIWDRGY